MSPEPTHAQLAVEDNIRVEQYDIDALRGEIPHWDQLSTDTKRRVLETEAPVSVSETSNVTCRALHDYLALALTLAPGEGGQLDQPAQIGFGDSTDSFGETDTALNNEVGERIDITDATSSGVIWSADEFLSSNEQNGNDLAEIGVFSRQGELYQHAPLSQTYEKDPTFALIINIRLAFADA